ncbi:MAG: thiamine phosphate synthase [Geothrix sp.]|uniref:thiamine phosphate synthase n=1 Tax=Geothrix sp. TaxID=1962974 RepID=UPI0017A4E376|nr:thiamine phosphate synthase [Geothrix sp.]NWJ41561.1 thiamine phosphate synthase [Geothrix sp.]WIL20455.1 MAG: thiamine phosphate synthase [Geothrix sp.]
MILLAITQGIGFDPQAWRGVLTSGVDAFLIREKGLSARALLEAARWCQDTAPGVELWIGGRLDVALAVGCGLHAPEAHPEVGPGLVPLSRPLHGEEQWAGRSVVEQLLVAPIFATPGKTAPWGPQRLHRFLDGLPGSGPRILALGGVDPLNARPLQHPRLAGFAAIRPFWSGDPAGAVARFRGQ